MSDFSFFRNGELDYGKLAALGITKDSIMIDNMKVLLYWLGLNSDEV